MRKRFPLLVLFILITLLRGSVAWENTVFPEPPKATAQWQLTPENHLGMVMEATIVITTKRGALAVTEWLPKEGETLKMWEDAHDIEHELDFYSDWVPVLEGELEIVSRVITQHNDGDQVITKVKYGLIYLDPFDFTLPRDEMKLPGPGFSQRYLTFSKSGKLTWMTNSIFLARGDFYIVPRVDADSKPYFKLFDLARPESPWRKVKLAGLGLIGVAIALVTWRVGRFVIIRRRRNQEVARQSVPDANDLYQRWLLNPQNGEVFIEAMKLYRRGVWGRPSVTSWARTTWILYSGIKLDNNRMGQIFTQLVREVSA